MNTAAVTTELVLPIHDAAGIHDDRAPRSSVAWHALWTRSHCEQPVHDQLAAKGFDLLLPKIEQWSRRGGLRHLIRVPMFSGYVFLRAAMDKASYVEVVKARGLVQVLGERWDRLTTIPDREIDTIRRIVDARIPALPYPYLREGQRVRITLGPEDLLDIAVWNNTAISRAVPVRPDGKISLPLLNDVQAAGLTPSQLREVLAKRLADYMPTPEVSVIVREVHSFKVSVIGEIKTPGRYELKSRATVLDVLAQAGPFSDFASRARIFVLRFNGTTAKRLPFNYNKVIAADGEQENFFLQPGDIVVVP